MTKMTTIGVAALCLAMPFTYAQTTLTSGHLDIGAAFEDNELHIHLHDEANELEYEPGEVFLQVGPQSFSLIPNDPRYAFLGQAGSATYILPQVENPNLLFLGIGAEEVETGIFQNDEITFSLRAVVGPGEFAAYSVDGFGNPTVFFNSRDGIGANDRLTVQAGSHRDLNWSFGAPGEYRVTLEAEGQLIGGGSILSGPVDFNFTVVPEPSTWALLGLGGMALAIFSRKKS